MFDYNPEWTTKFNAPHPQEMTCPYCGQMAFNAHVVLEPLFEMGAYEVRHIPPKLIFTCGNEACEHCDNDFVYVVECTITVSPANNGLQKTPKDGDEN